MADYAKGSLMRELREARHMSREDAAHAIGVTTRALYVWETKDGPIKWANAQRAAAVYEVEPETIVSREKLDSYAEQLDRIEAMLTELLELAREQDAAEVEAELDAAPLPADKPAASTAPAARAPRKANRGR